MADRQGLEQPQQLYVHSLGVTMYNATSEADVLNYVNNMRNSIGYIDWAYLQNNLQSATNVVVISVVNAQNGLSQTPTTQSIQAEIINMNNKNYDSSLCRQLYYITNGQLDSLVSNYINWAMSPYLLRRSIAWGYIAPLISGYRRTR